MTIKIGDKLPNATFRLMTADGPKPVTTQEFFAGRKIVLFGLPGAFTPTCHKNHLPGFLAEEAAIKAKGVDAIAMTSVNDPLRARRLGQGDRRGRPHRLSRRRQRRFRQGGGARLRRLGRRPRRALAAAIRRWSRTAWSSSSTSRNRRARPTCPGAAHILAQI